MLKVFVKWNPISRMWMLKAIAIKKTKIGELMFDLISAIVAWLHSKCILSWNDVL